MEKKRNGEIDLLRFVFSAIIVIHHFTFSYNFSIFKQGYIGVEFFFLLSGYLMAKSANKLITQNNKLTSLEIANSSWSFIAKKIKSFYIYYVAAIIIQVIVKNILMHHDNAITLVSNFLRSIPTFTLTFMGFNNKSPYLYVGSTWYLSAMIIAMFILFPLLLRNFEYSSKLIFPALSMFAIGYLYTTNNSIANWQGWSGICFNGILRALGEISLGASLYVLSNWLRDKYGAKNNKLVKIWFTVIKWFCFAVVFSFAIGLWSTGAFNLHAYLFCAIGIVISFSGITYCIPESKLSNYLGKISLPIYIFHSIVKYYIVEFIKPESVSLKVFILMAVFSIIISVILMYIVDLIKIVVKIIYKKVSISK